MLLPALTLQFASFAELFGGSVLAENVFSYPGLGSAAAAAGLNADVPLLLGITLFSALFVCVGNTIANLLYGVIDPQIRGGGPMRRINRRTQAVLWTALLALVLIAIYIIGATIPEEAYASSYLRAKLPPSWGPSLRQPTPWAGIC